jgi:SAM-dependent methyltransferase
VELESFVLAHVPPPPSRVLEVGCGTGELARALEGAGHQVVAIDPEAPHGRVFRRISLQEFADPAGFDAVVASRSLHHIADLDAALAKISTLLRPDGVLVIYEHAWDLLDESTARWYLSHSAAADPAAPRSLQPFLSWWSDQHAGLHGYVAMRSELDRRFTERLCEWAPYLYLEFNGAVDPAEEMRLIEDGTIQATGFCYVGVGVGRE